MPLPQVRAEAGDIFILPIQPAAGKVTISVPLGAEKLSGCGDMLALLPPNRDLLTIQGSYASYEDIQQSVPHPPQKIDPLDFPADASDDVSTDFQQYLRPGDTYGFQLAVELVIAEPDKASTSYLQRNLKIGYNRAAEYMDLLWERGVIKN